MASAAATLRHFNRTYTQRIGALQESFLGLGMPLAGARLLYEIGAEGASVLELRERLDLDSGYLSRLLRDLEQRELVRTSPDPVDRRRRRVALTRRGRNARRRLEDRAQALADALLEPLSHRQRQRLVEALETADLLVRAATVTFREVRPATPLARSAVDHYFAELDRRFPTGFDAAAARTADATNAIGSTLVAVSDGRPVACGNIHSLSPTVVEIKRMWVDPDWRGAGLGSRLLRHLEALAVRDGYDVVRLDTNRVLVEAIALYERSGYRPIERYNDNPYAQAWFEKAL